MPETWIKLRDDLDTDPRVARMAVLLNQTAASYVLATEARDLFGSVTKAVTRHAMRDVTLAGLARVWSHANRHTQDGVFRHTGLDYLDDLARIPGFGRAMQAVGWALHDPETDTVTLPNFIEHNAPDKNGQRSQTAAARRAQRYRDRIKNQPSPAADPPITDDRERDAVTLRVTPTVTPESVMHHVTSNVTPSISYSSSISGTGTVPEGESRGETRTTPSPLEAIDEAKRRINRLRQSWHKLPHWSAEEDAALYAALGNLRALEDQDWCILAYWLRWAHSAANTQSKDPVRVTSRRHAFVTDLPAYLDRAVTHWKQTGCPKLNADGTIRKATSTTPAAPAVNTEPEGMSDDFRAMLTDLKIPPRQTTVATKPAAA